MALRLSRRDAETIRAQACAAAPQECCGLLLGDRATGTVTALRPAFNVAADPRRRFEIDPAVLIAAHKAARVGGPAILGLYHSHPGGDSAPSTTDAAEAEGAGEIWLIVGGDGTLAAWRAGPGGARHGRFTQVEIATIAE